MARKNLPPVPGNSKRNPNAKTFVAFQISLLKQEMQMRTPGFSSFFLVY